MADQRPIVWGPGDKLAWLEEVASDPDATDLDARSAVAISKRINKHTGLAIVSQETIARDIGRPEGTATRSVFDSTRRLERLGRLAITKSTGRGNAHVYRPISETKQRRAKGGGQPPETQRVAAEKPGGQPSPLPNKNLNSSHKPGGQPPPFENADAQRRSIGLKLLEQIGPDQCASWFGNTSILQITDDEIVIETASPFARKQIEDRFSEALVRAARAADPNITVARARIVLAGTIALEAAAQ